MASANSPAGVSYDREMLAQVQGKLINKIKLNKINVSIFLAQVYTALADNIKQEKLRIGGHFAVAYVVISKHDRDAIREVLGDDVVFVNLNMTKEDRKKRLVKRHDGDTSVADMIDVTKCHKTKFFHS